MTTTELHAAVRAHARIVAHCAAREAIVALPLAMTMIRAILADKESAQ